MGKQYQYVEGSDSGHCCFEASVVTFDGEQFCECFSPEDARSIVKAVNYHERLVEMLDKVLNMYPWNTAVEAEARALLAELEAQDE